MARAMRRWGWVGAILMSSGAAHAGLLATRGSVVGGVGNDPAGLAPVVDLLVDDESRPFGLSAEEIVAFKQKVTVQYKTRTRVEDGQVAHRVVGRISMPTCAEARVSGTWSFRIFANEPEKTEEVELGAEPTAAEAAASELSRQDLETMAGDALREPVATALEGYARPCEPE